MFSTANGNISVPIGTIEFVTEHLGKLGLRPVFARIKRKGIPLNPLIHALISYWLTENSSIEGCGRWLQNPIVGREFGILGKVSSRMLNRAVETVGKHMEEIVSASAFFLRNGMIFPMPTATSTHLSFPCIRNRAICFLSVIRGTKGLT